MMAALRENMEVGPAMMRQYVSLASKRLFVWLMTRGDGYDLMLAADEILQYVRYVVDQVGRRLAARLERRGNSQVGSVRA